MKDEDNIKMFGVLGVEEFEMEERAENREMQSPGGKKICLHFRTFAKVSPGIKVTCVWVCFL